MKNTQVLNKVGGQQRTVRLKLSPSGTKHFSGTVACVSLVTFLFAFALLVPHCAGLPAEADLELVHAEHIVSEAAHELARRGDCNETAITYESDADAATATVGTTSVLVSALTESSPTAMTSFTGDVTQSGGVTFPISTETALSTLCSISFPEVTTLTSTTTATTAVTASSESVSVESDCHASTIFITVTVVPTPSESPTVASSLADATVTGGAGTVTDVSTDVSYTSGAPDVTVSGNPSTVTDVQTSVSVTTAPSDATVPGNPSTVTNLETDYSLTTSLSDATISGAPGTVTDIGVSYSLSTSTGSVITKVISDLFSPLSPVLSTVTAVATAKTTVTTLDSSIITITISDLYPPTPVPASTIESSDAKGQGATATTSTVSSTSTLTVTETGGPPAVSTTVVEVPPSAPYPGGNATVVNPSGTVSVLPAPTTPVVVSDGTKKPEPRGLTMGTTNLGCTVMLVALIMFML